MFSLLIFETIQRSTQYKRQRIHQSGVSTNVSLLQSNGECPEKPDHFTDDIFKAIYNDDFASFRYLACNSPKTQLNKRSYFYGQEGNPLMYSIYYKKYGVTYDIIFQYLSYVDINARSSNNKTALHFAYSNMENNLVCMLIARGADHLKDKFGQYLGDDVFDWIPICP